ncbi:MAG: polysaccharide deacetylase family protein [Cyclobacteriaceae bacterium]|nr:polysaccharide deacetylase family protein [Cyclobacteriaceae bacterium]
MNKSFLSRVGLCSFAAIVFVGFMSPVSEVNTESSQRTCAEKLGFPSGKRVVMLHADDFGMNPEANEATIDLLKNGYIQSAASMPPCPAYGPSIEWAKKNPKIDVGIHLAITSEWNTYRWGPVSPPEEVPGLIDPEGKLWKNVPLVVKHGKKEEVAKELRAQMEKTIAMGYRPDHMDTHMGALFGHKNGSDDFSEVFFKLAEEYNIPANVIDFANPKIEKLYSELGYPISDRLKELVRNYSLPKLDYFTSVPKGSSYEEVCENFKNQIRNLEPGLSEIIFHPSAYSEELKTVAGSWQQRVWEYQMFSDPSIQKFLKDEDIIFTNWKDIMVRHEKMKSRKKKK